MTVANEHDFSDFDDLGVIEYDSDNFEDMSLAEQDAFCLVQSAVALDQSRNDEDALATALEKNMELWIAIRTVVSQDENPLNAETKENLGRLSQHVVEATIGHGMDISSAGIDILVNINLHISEGLLEGNSDTAKLLI